MTGGPSLVVDAAAAFAALADELQTLAGNRSADAPGGESKTSQNGDFTAADRERLQKIFGDPDDSLADGIETNIEEIRSAVSSILHQQSRPRLIG